MSGILIEYSASYCYTNQELVLYVCEHLQDLGFIIYRVSRVSVMSMIDSEVYEAFIAAGTPKDKAKSAAEAIANYESRFNKLDKETMLIKWMVGFNLAFTMAIVYKLFFV